MNLQSSNKYDLQNDQQKPNDKAAGAKGQRHTGRHNLIALCFYSSSVLVDSFVLTNPAQRQSPKPLSVNLKDSFK
jgi:hypothetical protein